MRARNIKPGFFRNEDLARVSPTARLLFAGLWCLADREGRLEDRPARIKAEVLPFDDVDVDALLDELAELRDYAGEPATIVRYTVDGRRYIQVIHFLRHQRPHHNERASEIPPPPGGLGTKVTSACYQGDKSDAPRTAALRPDSPNAESPNAEDGPPETKASSSNSGLDVGDVSEDERYVAGKVLAVPGANEAASEAEVVATLRECLGARAHPIPSRVLRSEFVKFEAHWAAKRAGMGGPWVDWVSRLSNWLGQIPDEPVLDDRDGRPRQGPYVDVTGVPPDWDRPTDPAVIRRRRAEIEAALAEGRGTR